MSFQKKKVLAVDDIDSNRLLLKELLEGVGLEVVIAKDGVEAVKLSLEVKPDLIIMDIMMPEMDGIQATSIIKEEPNTASIPCCNDCYYYGRKDAKVGNVQFDGFIYKPVTVSRLLEEIKRFIPLLNIKN